MSRHQKHWTDDLRRYGGLERHARTPQLPKRYSETPKGRRAQSLLECNMPCFLTKAEKQLDIEEIAFKTQAPRNPVSASQEFQVYREFLTSIVGFVSTKHREAAASLQRGLSGLHKAFLRLSQAPLVSNNTCRSKPKQVTQAVQTKDLEPLRGEDWTAEIENLKSLQVKLKSLSVTRVVTKLRRLQEYLKLLKVEIPEPTELPEIIHFEISLIAKEIEHSAERLETVPEESPLETAVALSTTYRPTSNQETQTDPIQSTNSANHYLEILQEKEIELFTVKRKLEQALQQSTKQKYQPLTYANVLEQKCCEAEEDILQLKHSLRAMESNTSQIKREHEATKRSIKVKSQQIEITSKVVDTVDKKNKRKILRLQKLEDQLCQAKLQNKTVAKKLAQIESAWRTRNKGQPFVYSDIHSSEQLLIPKEDYVSHYEKELSAQFTHSLYETFAENSSQVVLSSPSASSSSSSITVLTNEHLTEPGIPEKSKPPKQTQRRVRRLHKGVDTSDLLDTKLEQSVNPPGSRVSQDKRQPVRHENAGHPELPASRDQLAVSELAGEHKDEPRKKASRSDNEPLMKARRNHGRPSEQQSSVDRSSKPTKPRDISSKAKQIHQKANEVRPTKHFESSNARLTNSFESSSSSEYKAGSRPTHLLSSAKKSKRLSGSPKPTTRKNSKQKSGFPSLVPEYYQETPELRQSFAPRQGATVEHSARKNHGGWQGEKTSQHLEERSQGLTRDARQKHGRKQAEPHLHRNWHFTGNQVPSSQPASHVITASPNRDSPADKKTSDLPLHSSFRSLNEEESGELQHSQLRDSNFSPELSEECVSMNSSMLDVPYHQGWHVSQARASSNLQDSFLTEMLNSLHLPDGNSLNFYVTHDKDLLQEPLNRIQMESKSGLPALQSNYSYDSRSSSISHPTRLLPHRRQSFNAAHFRNQPSDNHPQPNKLEQRFEEQQRRQVDRLLKIPDLMDLVFEDPSELAAMPAHMKLALFRAMEGHSHPRCNKAEGICIHLKRAMELRKKCSRLLYPVKKHNILVE